MMPGATRSMGRDRFVRIGPSVVDGSAQGIDDSPQQRIARGHREHAAQGAHRAALHNPLVGPQDDGAHAIGLQVHGHALGLGLEFEHLAHDRVFEARDAHDPVTHFGYRAHDHRAQIEFELADLLLQRFEQRAYAALALREESLSRCRLSGRPSCSERRIDRPTRGAKVMAQRFEAPLQAAVDDRVTNLDPDAAQDSAIDSTSSRTGMPTAPFERPRQAACFSASVSSTATRTSAMLSR